MTMFLQSLSSVLAWYYGFREIQLMQVFVDHVMNDQKKNQCSNDGRLEGHIDALCHFEHCKCFFCNSYSLLRSRNFLKCPGRKRNYVHGGWLFTATYRTGMYTIAFCTPKSLYESENQVGGVHILQPSVPASEISWRRKLWPGGTFLKTSKWGLCTCSWWSSQRSTIGWLALRDDRVVSLWNWVVQPLASRGRLL